MAIIDEIIGLLSVRLFVPQAMVRLIAAFRLVIGSITALAVRVTALEAGGGSGWIPAYKPEDTQRTDDTLADDPDLTFPVTAGIYAIRGYIGLVMTDVEGFRFTLNGPTTSHISLSYDTPIDREYRDDFSVMVFSPGAPGTASIIISGTITFSAAGDVAFQWAQETDVVGALTSVFQGSHLEYLRLGGLP